MLEVINLSETVSDYLTENLGMKLKSYGVEEYSYLSGDPYHIITKGLKSKMTLDMLKEFSEYFNFQVQDLTLKLSDKSSIKLTTTLANFEKDLKELLSREEVNVSYENISNWTARLKHAADFLVIYSHYYNGAEPYLDLKERGKDVVDLVLSQNFDKLEKSQIQTVKNEKVVEKSGQAILVTHIAKKLNWVNKKNLTVGVS